MFWKQTKSGLIILDLDLHNAEWYEIRQMECIQVIMYTFSWKYLRFVNTSVRFVNATHDLRKIFSNRKKGF